MRFFCRNHFGGVWDAFGIYGADYRVTPSSDAPAPGPGGEGDYLVRDTQKSDQIDHLHEWIASCDRA